MRIRPASSEFANAGRFEVQSNCPVKACCLDTPDVQQDAIDACNGRADSSDVVTESRVKRLHTLQQHVACIRRLNRIVDRNVIVVSLKRKARNRIHVVRDCRGVPGQAERQRFRFFRREREIAARRYADLRIELLVANRYTQSGAIALQTRRHGQRIGITGICNRCIETRSGIKQLADIRSAETFREAGTQMQVVSRSPVCAQLEDVGRSGAIVVGEAYGCRNIERFHDRNDGFTIELEDVIRTCRRA